MPAAPRFSPRTLGLGAAVITVLVWTAFIVIARASAGRSLTPFDIAFARICGASLVLIPWGAWIVARDRDPARRSLFGLSPVPLRLTATAGVFGGLAYALLAYTGFFFAPATHASVLMPGSLPLWTALLAAIVLHDRITPGRALGLLLIVLGDLFVGGGSLLHALEGGVIWKGDLLFMSAAFCWASYSVVVRKYGLDAVRATIAITVFAFMTYIPVYTLLAATGVVTSHLATAPVGEIAFQMLFQGIGSVVISGITFTRMIQYFGPVRTTMITALVPGLSALGAVVFLGEPLQWNLIAGLMLVTAGILFGVQRVRAGAVPQAVPARTARGGADA
ncbi:DMT family transporter [Variovorax sp. Sphag1AA]|uniref:DMT family transporter n=1 Tax=Variovorax sp. Sphag1AA TaxID=2587027 RepID=UPI00161BD760|nr:DMT family transporter [Variovorax sp. Sphag1AA]MBB3180608.1 drug/metabolite transporter (DMT)-like permease [Variovorax sp. Sphag1AA]